MTHGRHGRRVGTSSHRSQSILTTVSRPTVRAVTEWWNTDTVSDEPTSGAGNSSIAPSDSVLGLRQPPPHLQNLSAGTATRCNSLGCEVRLVGFLDDIFVEKFDGLLSISLFDREITGTNLRLTE